MHIVFGFLTSLITILYLLDRMGVNLGGLNPRNPSEDAIRARSRKAELGVRGMYNVTSR